MLLLPNFYFFFFFFNDTATTEIYTLSLHDALPILRRPSPRWRTERKRCRGLKNRSEEHTSELQSPKDLVCRLLLEKKKKQQQGVDMGERRGKAETQSREERRH